MSAPIAACTSLQVPLAPPTFKPDQTLCADKSGLHLAVKPIEGVSSYWNLFEDNLPEIGVAVAWVALRNDGDQTFDLTRSKWSLKIGDRKFEKIEGITVLSRYYKRRHIRIYTVAADAKARRELESITLHPCRLRPAMEVEGLVFFTIDPALAPLWARGALLKVSGIRSAQGKGTELSLPLSYASP